ncbi:MAG: hypothetical protein ABDH37_05605 [Candidatus Hydrothermales bacterium]
MFIFYLIFYFLIEERGYVRSWIPVTKGDSLFLFYTLDKDYNNFAEEIKLFKFDIKKKNGKIHKIFSYDKGIGDIKFKKIKNDFILYFPLYDYLGDKKTRKLKKIFYFRRNKIKKTFEVDGKNIFFYRFDFYDTTIENSFLLDLRGKIFITKNGEKKEITNGVYPLIFYSNIFFLHGSEDGKINSLFKINKDGKKDLFFNKEPVLEMDKENRFMFLLTDKDQDLLPEKVYIIDSLLNLNLLFDSDYHIIIKPSFITLSDTLFVLLSLSEEMIPVKILFLKVKENKVLFKKEVLYKGGIEAKWLYYPYLISLQKANFLSRFEIISVK